MIHIFVVIMMLVMVVSAGSVYAQTSSSDSFFERRFGEVKFIDAYFGTEDQKIEITPGDRNVPFTVILANIGTEDITGIKGQLALPLGFAPAGSSAAMAEADSVTNTGAGENFALKFFVDVDPRTIIGDHQASVKVDYTRFRESGMRNAYFDFGFRVTGDSVINMKAIDPFLVSLQQNTATIELSNTGTAPASGIDIELVNTQDTISSTAQSITNTENVVILETNWDVGNIAPGESKYFDVEIYVPESVKGETLRAPMQITYFNAYGDEFTISRIVDFYVKGFIDPSIYNVDVIDLSGKPTIVGSIINEGNEDALFGFVTVAPRSESNIISTTQFIDEIEVDSPVPFNVQVDFDGEPVYGEHDILITVRYKDSIREETFLTHEATIYIEEPSVEEGQNSGLMSLLVLPVAAAVGIFGLRRYKKAKQSS